DEHMTVIGGRTAGAVVGRGNCCHADSVPPQGRDPGAGKLEHATACQPCWQSYVSPFLPAADNLAGAAIVAFSVRRRRESRRLAGADEAEFSAFVAREGGQLLGFAVLLVSNRHDAEDLVQQALLRTAGRWPAARQSPA